MLSGPLTGRVRLTDVDVVAFDAVGSLHVGGEKGYDSLRQMIRTSGSWNGGCLLPFGFQARTTAAGIEF